MMNLHCSLSVFLFFFQVGEKGGLQYQKLGKQILYQQNLLDQEGVFEIKGKQWHVWQQRESFSTLFVASLPH